jgi:hypothetical protein
MNRILLSLIAIGVILGALPAYSEWGNNIGTQGLKYASISTATTTVIKSAFCFIHTLTVTGGTAGVINLYSSSGNPINPFQGVAFWSSTNAPQSYLFDVNLASGCTVTTGAATNITVSYL